MTALLGERDRPYETAEETDAIRPDATKEETDATAVETEEMTTEETDVTLEATDVLTIPLVTNNDSRDPPPSARR